MQYNINYRKKDGSWQFIISYKDNDGKWKQKSKQGFPLDRSGKDKCKDAADQALKELKETLIEKVHLDNEYDDITLGEFVDLYLKRLSLHREHNTIVSYETALTGFKNLEAKKLKEITSSDIQECIDSLIKKNLKVSSISIYLKRLASVFLAAVKQYKIIIKSPVEDITLPESKDLSNKKALTTKQYNELLRAFKDSEYYIIILIAGSCGLRIGEILGLTWDSIDSTNCLMIVDKQWKKDKNNKYGFGDLKSTNSYRKVPLTSMILNELQKYKTSHCTDINNRILTNSSTSSIVTSLNNKLKKKGFNISIHELRHTYASNLIANHMEFKTAASILGHDVIQTMKTYSHITDDMFDNAAKIVNKIYK